MDCPAGSFPGALPKSWAAAFPAEEKNPAASAWIRTRRRGSSSSPHGFTAADPPRSLKRESSPANILGIGPAEVPPASCRPMLTHNVRDPAGLEFRDGDFFLARLILNLG